MNHTIMVEAMGFAESLKAAQNYAQKDAFDNNAMNHILVRHLPKEKKLAIIACDGHGYYERKLALAPDRKTKQSLPGQQICIPLKDAATLVKLIPGKSPHAVTIEIEEGKNKDYAARVILPDNSTASFACKSDLDIPDYSVITKRAEKGRKTAPTLSDVHIPIHEMVRAGKVFPAKNGDAVRMFTTSGANNGIMALLESIDGQNEIKVIFMFCGPVENAA